MSTRRRATAMKKNSIPFRHLREAYAIFNKTNGKSLHTVRGTNSALSSSRASLGRKQRHPGAGGGGSTVLAFAEARRLPT